jgi:multimeric flavodoxin WrbA
MTSPRILCIHASERPQGNTRVLFDQAIKGAESAGAEIERIYVRELHFAPCDACGGCHDDGPCALQDDMTQVYPLLRKCDRFLIASPIYFWSLPGRFKCLIDRCQRFWYEKYVLKQKVAQNPGGMERLGAFIAVCGHPNGDLMFSPAEKIIKAWLNCLDATLAHTLYVPDTDKPADILKKPGVMAKALEIGRTLAVT